MSFRGLSQSDRIRRIKDAALYANFVNILNTQPNCISVTCANYGDCIVRYPTYEYRQNVTDGAKECDNCDCFITSTIPSTITALGFPWIEVTALPNRWRQIIYAGGQFITVAYFGPTAIMRSTDGITWTAATLILTPINAVEYGNGQYVAIGPEGYILYSSDGASWTRQQLPLDIFASFNGIAFGNSTFVIVGYNTSSLASYVYTTPDGILLSPQLAQNGNWNSVAYGNNRFVAIGDAGAIMTSPNGLTWTLQTGPNSNDWFRIKFINNLFFAIASTGANPLMSSPDGINWTVYSSAPSGRDITYYGGTYIIVRSNNIYSSTDLISWTIRNNTSNHDWYSVTYGAGYFVAVDGDINAPYVAYAP